MSTQKHTSGPWKFSFESIDSEWAIVTTASGSIIANVNSDQRQKANARLIAAAPELLSALKGAASAISRALPFLPADTEAHFSGEWLAEIREAIAKAEAEQ